MAYPASPVISRVIGSENNPIDVSMKCPIYSVEDRVENSGMSQTHPIINFIIDSQGMII